MNNYTLIIVHRLDEECCVKVGDFGLAREVSISDYYRLSRNTKLPFKWLSPETFNDGISNEKTDVVNKLIILKA